MNERTQSALHHITLIVCALTTVAYCATVQLAGGSAVAFLWYLVLTAALIFLPGLWLCNLLLPQARGTARVACAYALGVALVWICYALVGLLHRAIPQLSLFAMFVPPLGLTSWQLVSRWRRLRAGAHGNEAAPKGAMSRAALRSPFAAFSPATCALLLCLCGGLVVYCFTGVLAFAHATAAGNMQYHQDMLWSVGNGAAVQLGFPLRDVRAAGGVLYYHYLADAVPGLLAMAGGILPYDAACYYNYPVLLLVLICAAHAAARAYGAAQQHAVALPFALLFLQGFDSDATLNLLRNMNGVIAATALACVVLYLLFWAEAQGFSCKYGVHAGFYLAFALCLGTLLVSKNLYGILLVCAILAAVLVGCVLHRRFYRQALGMGLIGAALFGLLWLFLFRFAINNLVQEIWQNALQIPRTLALWLPLGFALYLVSLVCSVRHLRALSFGRLVVNAAVLGGLLAYFLFHHYSASQVYFMLAAILFLWFCALDALPFLAGVRWRRIAVVALATVSVCGTLLTLLPVARTSVQVALRCLSLRPPYPYAQDTVTADDEAAALWLRSHMDTDDLFATNRNAKDMTIGEGTWHYYTAVSGRQAFVESWRYAMDYGMNYTVLRHNLEQVSDVIFTQKTTAAAFALAQEYGIRYLLVSIPHQPTPWTDAQPVYENSAVRIYEVSA